jgi:hypothetical protein
MLRYRRVDLVLELSLLAAIAIGLAGLLVVLVLDPLAVVLALPVGLTAGIVLGRLIGERAVAGVILGVVISLLALGLYALYLLLELSTWWAAGLAGVVLILFGTVLSRALLATADDPPP